MKRGATILLIGLLAGIVAFFAMRSQKTRDSHGAMVDQLPELTWLRSELDLSPRQYEQVRELHASYWPTCVEMCARIEAAKLKVAAAAEGPRTLTPDLKAAVEEHARVVTECREAMLTHLYQTAGLLDDTQSRRYLDLMLPYALDLPENQAEESHAH